MVVVTFVGVKMVPDFTLESRTAFGRGPCFGVEGKRPLGSTLVVVTLVGSVHGSNFTDREFIVVMAEVVVACRHRGHVLGLVLFDRALMDFGFGAMVDVGRMTWEFRVQTRVLRRSIGVSDDAIGFKNSTKVFVVWFKIVFPQRMLLRVLDRSLLHLHRWMVMGREQGMTMMSCRGRIVRGPVENRSYHLGSRVLARDGSRAASGSDVSLVVRVGERHSHGASLVVEGDQILLQQQAW